VVKRVSLIYLKLPSGGEWKPNFQVYFKIVVNYWRHGVFGKSRQMFGVHEVI